MIRLTCILWLINIQLGCKPHPPRPDEPTPSDAAQQPVRIFQFPTDNRALLEAGMEEKFYAPTTTARTWASGSFGCVRNSGTRMHEGIDIISIKRDEDDEPLDAVRAAATGKVAYISRNAAASNYGKYVTLVHEYNDMPFYTLYAHLESVADSLREGQPIQVGQEIGVLGRTTNTSDGIAAWRAHLHFEIGVQINSRFSGWYKQWFREAKNFHGPWHGYNLIGLNAAEILVNDYEGEFDLTQYIQSLPVLCRVRVYQSELDWADRYPQLVSSPHPNSETPVAWDLDLSVSGIPIKAAPVHDADNSSNSKYSVLSVNDTARSKDTCIQLLFRKGQQWVFTGKGQRHMEMLIYR